MISTVLVADEHCNAQEKLLKLFERCPSWLNGACKKMYEDKHNQ